MDLAWLELDNDYVLMSKEINWNWQWLTTLLVFVSWKKQTETRDRGVCLFVEFSRTIFRPLSECVHRIMRRLWEKARAKLRPFLFDLCKEVCDMTCVLCGHWTQARRRGQKTILIIHSMRQGKPRRCWDLFFRLLNLFDSHLCSLGVWSE